MASGRERDGTGGAGIRQQPDLLPETSLGFQVAHLGRLLGRELRSRLAPYAVAPGQFAVLLELFRHDGLTQAELCDRVDIEQPTMANTLTRMQRDGLVTRAPDPSDRRRTRILLTDRARALETDLADAARAGNAAALEGLDERQVHEFMAVLVIMIENLGRPERPDAAAG